MKTIGILGGMSWESTLEYYRIMNRTVKEKLGKLHSAKVLLYSFDFEEIENLQHKGEWDELTKLMIKQAKMLEQAGAEMIVIATNTMHKMADHIEANTNIPLVHIADVTATAIKKMNLQKVALLGTRFTMEGDFYVARLQDKHDIETLIPDDQERQIIHDVIYGELCLGRVRDESRKKYLAIIDSLTAMGAQGIILGCTEIPLLIKQENVSIPLLDTTTIHARAAVFLAVQ